MSTIPSQFRDSDIQYIVANLRERDRAEVAAIMEPDHIARVAVDIFNASAWRCITFSNRTKMPVSFMCFNPISKTTLSASLLSTAQFHETANELIRWGLKIFKPEAIKAGFRRLECRTIVGHHSAIMFLQRLGFRQECVIEDYGANGEVFLQYAWRVSDNVPLFSESDRSGTAAASAEGGRERGQGSRTDEALATEGLPVDADDEPVGGAV